MAVSLLPRSPLTRPGSRTRRLTRLGLLVALGLILNLLERQLPPPVPLPGVRLGLANIATLMALLLDGPTGGLWVWGIRFGLANLFAGGLLGPGFAVGGAGGLAAWAAMALVIRWTAPEGRATPRGLALPGVSLVGAAAHHLGQLLAAVWVTARPEVLHLLPALLATAVPVGLLTGVGVALVLRPLAPALGLSRTWSRLGRPRAADWALVAGLVALALVLALALSSGTGLRWPAAFGSGGHAAAVGRGGAVAMVNLAGRPAMRLDLQEDGVYPLTAPGVQMQIEVRRGAVRIRESNCPDQVCVLSGWARSPGEVIVCVPNRVVVVIAGSREEGPDAILR